MRCSYLVDLGPPAVCGDGWRPFRRFRRDVLLELGVSVVRKGERTGTGVLSGEVP